MSDLNYRKLQYAPITDAYFETIDKMIEDSIIAEKRRRSVFSDLRNSFCKFIDKWRTWTYNKSRECLEEQNDIRYYWLYAQSTAVADMPWRWVNSV